MTTEQFNLIVEEQLLMCKRILIEKTKEYVLDNNDRLKAFKRLWLNELMENQKEILWGQMAKHLDSIYDMCHMDITYDKEHIDKWDEKITDTINYLIILKGIVHERVQSE